MSRFTREADIDRSPWDVSFVPIADIERSIDWLRLWEFPLATQDFGVRAIEPHRVVPARHCGQTVLNFAVAAVELDYG